jgi:hypothetical protein
VTTRYKSDRSLALIDDNGYPTPANLMGTRVKWGRVWLSIGLASLLIEEKLYPSGLTEAGMGVPNPYPLTRIPDYEIVPTRQVSTFPVFPPPPLPLASLPLPSSKFFPTLLAASVQPWRSSSTDDVRGHKGLSEPTPSPRFLEGSCPKSLRNTMKRRRAPLGRARFVVEHGGCIHELVGFFIDAPLPTAAILLSCGYPSGVENLARYGYNRDLKLTVAIQKKKELTVDIHSLRL